MPKRIGQSGLDYRSTTISAANGLSPDVHFLPGECGNLQISCIGGRVFDELAFSEHQAGRRAVVSSQHEVGEALCSSRQLAPVFATGRFSLGSCQLDHRNLQRMDRWEGVSSL